MFMVRTRGAVIARKPPSLWSHQDKGGRALRCQRLADPSASRLVASVKASVIYTRADITALVAASATFCQFLIKSG